VTAGGGHAEIRRRDAAACQRIPDDQEVAYTRDRLLRELAGAEQRSLAPPTPNQEVFNEHYNSIAMAMQVAAHFWLAPAHALQQRMSLSGTFIFFVR
jgi:hypothetical protein